MVFKRPKELEILYEEVDEFSIGYYDIDFNAGYSAGNGKAQFNLAVDPGYFYQPPCGNYEYQYERTGECILQVWQNAETGEISFHSEIEVNFYEYDFDSEEIVRHGYSQENDSTWMREHAHIEIILEYINEQCQKETGKSLYELLNQPFSVCVEATSTLSDRKR